MEFTFAVTFGWLLSSNVKMALNGRPIMRRKNIIGLVLITVAVAATLMVFASSSPVTTDSSCKEGLDEPVKKINSGKMIWENLSHQFFSTL